MDVGSVRVGVATCDPAGLIATPVETVRRGRGDLDRLAALVAERAAVEVVVGLPTRWPGRPGGRRRGEAAARGWPLAERLGRTPAARMSRSGWWTSGCPPWVPSVVCATAG